MGNLTKLLLLDISDNSIAEISSESFSNLISLKTLIIAMFPAEKFAPRPFAALESLESLRLGGLRVTSVPDDLLYGLDKLKFLDVFHWTNLRSFPETFLTHTPLLSSFKLSFMPDVDNLPQGFLRGLKQLSKVSIIGDERGFEIMPPNMWPVESLQEVIISKTSLQSLPVNFFSARSQVQTLILRQNQLVDVEAGLKNLRSLERLDLKWNNLTSISVTFFESLSNLTSVDLSHNKITSVDTAAFIGLTRLAELYLNHNSIHQLSASEPVFPRYSVLGTIDLSNNKLTKFPTLQLETIRSFTRLNLDNNFITYFRVTRYESSLTEISLKNNNITLINVNSVIRGATGNGVHNILLENNPIECTARNFEFFRYISESMEPELANFKDVRSCFCSGTKERLSAVRLRDLYSEYQNCPTLCNHCHFFPSGEYIKVHCGNRALTEIPELPQNVTHLIFNENSLVTYPKELSKYKALKMVNLDDNQITSIDSMLENAPELLEELSLRHNNLKRWQPELAGLGFDLDLMDNPWTCDCDAKDFKVFLLANFRRIKNYKELRCSKPVKVDGRGENLLSKITPQDLCPFDNRGFIALGVVVVFVFGLAFISMILYFKNRNLVIAFTYIHFHNVFVCFFKEDDLDEERKFDAFLSYSTSDRDVAIEILQRLETDAKASDTVAAPFNLCLHERDFMPGQTITWNILNAVRTSRRTILILSKEFLESVWFKVEFQAAYDQMLEEHVNRLILIIKGELPPYESLNENLQGVLRTKTYLIWGERWFWKKLLYAMPHRART